MLPLAISHYTVTSALGAGRAAQAAALADERSGLAPRRWETLGFDAWIGEADGLDAPLTGALAEWDCRNNRLAWLALQQDGFIEACAALRQRYGADRIGVFIGTSTAGIHQTELAYRARGADGPLPDWYVYHSTQNCYSPGGFVQTALGLSGISAVISTACSSSAKVFACAARAIASGQCDAAIVGGADSLCLTTLYGFNALQLVAREICRPADAQRSGISIGEAAGYAILEKPERAEAAMQLLGYGESSDAHHMSTPDPEGRGAQLAMRAALQRAGLAPGEIDYVNLHGTATPANDLSEDRALCAVFGEQTLCSSTKGWTGHTLGAAGILEAVLCLLAIEQALLPRSLNTRERDPALQGAVLMETRAAPVRRTLSNSFGFGGSNCSLVLGCA